MFDYNLFSHSALSHIPALARNLSGLVLSLSCLSFKSIAQANPIQADTSLRIPSVPMCSSNNCTINGGTPVGSNLFHSFSQFSVPTGGVVYFNNNPGIANIFSRVTGTSISNIDGLLKTNGSANLFLLNPNGIIFGSNAQLNIGGSLIATTASAIKFADGSSFFSNNSQTTPLLTVSVPVGLQFGSTPGSIQVQGTVDARRTTSDLIDTTFGLHVQPDQTLALVGGDIAIEGGILKTAGGRIELGSVDGGFVSITPINKGWELGYNDVSTFRNIELSGTSAVDASGAGGGDIQVWGNQIVLRDGSQIEAVTLQSQPGGTLAVHATEGVKLIGGSNPNKPTAFFTSVNSGATGKGGNIIISTKDLQLENGAVISSATFSTADAGNLLIDASESVKVLGVSILSTNTISIGKAGNLMLTTGTLTLQGGSQLLTSTLGKGAGGNLIVNARDLVELIGTDSQGTRSGLFAITRGQGAAGNVTVNTTNLIIRDGARASTSTRSSGLGGTLTVTATDSVQVSGISPDRKNPSGLFALSGESGPNFNPSRVTGTGGSLIVNTGQLSVQNLAQVSVSAIGLGAAGNLNLTAGAINLNNSGSISAETRVGTGGNINVQSQDLTLRHNSKITTSATGTASGGNISLNTNTLVGLENSTIKANAVQGRGGNIQISTQGVFLSPNSKISASSDLGVNGVVQVQILGFDVQNTLTPITKNLVSSEQILAGSCLTSRTHEQGRFVVTGTGGLPPNPYDPIRGQYDVMGLGRLSGTPGASSRDTYPERAWKVGDPIVEAQTIIVTPDGRTLLGVKPTGAIASASNLVCHPQG